jgi:hypothetical protein
MILLQAFRRGRNIYDSPRAISGPLIQDTESETLSEIAISNRMTSAEQEKIKAFLRRTSISPGAACSLTDAVKPASRTLCRFLYSDLAISTERCLEGRG